MKPSAASRSRRSGAGAASRVEGASAYVPGRGDLPADEWARLHETVVRSLEQHVPVLYEDKKLLEEGNYAALLAKLTARRDVLRGSPWEGPAILLAGVVGAFGFNKLLALRGLDSLDTLRSTMTTALIWAVSVPFTSRVRNARSLAAVDRARDALLILLGKSAAPDVQGTIRGAHEGRSDGERPQ